MRPRKKLWVACANASGAEGLRGRALRGVRVHAYVDRIAARVCEPVGFSCAHHPTTVVRVKAQIEAIALAKAHVVVAATCKCCARRAEQGLQQRAERGRGMEDHIVIHESQEGSARSAGNRVPAVAQA